MKKGSIENGILFQGKRKVLVLVGTALFELSFVKHLAGDTKKDKLRYLKELKNDKIGLSISYPFDYKDHSLRYSIKTLKEDIEMEF